MGVRDVLRLDRELEVVRRTRPQDAAASAKVLERAVWACQTDPVAAEHWVEVELLDELVDCYASLGRVDEAITVMRRALKIGWHGEPDGRCRIAGLLMRDGRLDQAGEIWQQVKADTPEDVWLYNSAGLEYEDIDDHSTALIWLTDGVQLAMRSGDPEALVGPLAELRAESMTELGLPEDQLQRDATKFAANPPPPPPRKWKAPTRPNTGPSTPRPATAPEVLMRPGRAGAATDRSASVIADPAGATHASGPISRPTIPVALAWFPADEYPEALRRWPDLTEKGPAMGAPDHAPYSRALQKILNEYANAGASRLGVPPILIGDFLEWCRGKKEDPAAAGSRARYAAVLGQQGRVTAWPPGRNRQCWYGSGRKYKLCCGRPRHETPDESPRHGPHPMTPTR